MPTGKRASMREGPLADLFRKTAEDTDELLRAIHEKARTGAVEARNVPARSTAAPLDLVSLLQKSLGANGGHSTKRAARCRWWRASPHHGAPASSLRARACCSTIASPASPQGILPSLRMVSAGNSF